MKIVYLARSLRSLPFDYAPFDFPPFESLRVYDRVFKSPRELREHLKE
jgi:hypothetical protein